MCKETKRSILYLAFLSITLMSFPVISQEVDKLEESTNLTIQCVKECREIEEKIQPLTAQLQNNLRQQQNSEDQLAQATDLYMKTVDLCNLMVFQEKNMIIIQETPPDPERSGMPEMGSIIPPECRKTLLQIEKDIASTLNHLAELLRESEPIQHQINKQEKRLKDCLENCEEIHKEGQQISEMIKNLMEQAIASPPFIAALARYDAADERMRRSFKSAEDGNSIRESIMASSKKTSQTLVSYQPSLKGIPISRKTSWLQLGFADIDSITREAAPYSGGTYLPTYLEKPFQKMGICQRPSLPKLIQKRDIPRLVKIIAPESAVPNRPLSLSIFDNENGPLSGIVMETGTGQAVKSGDHGKVFFPSLSVESKMLVFRIPGTSNGSACIGFPQEMPSIPEVDVPLNVDSTSAIVLIGSFATLQGSGFDGISENTEIDIGGKRLTSVAESPVSSKYKIPDDLTPGFYTVTVTENSKKTSSIPILCIKMDLMADQVDLKEGEAIKGRIHLEGTEKPLVIELINNSPSEISIEPHLVPVKGGKGEFRIKGLKSGPFRITVGAAEFPKKTK